MEYQAPIGKSDHVCLTWSLTVNRPIESETKTSYKRNFWKGDFAAINEAIHHVDWAETFRCETLENKWICFKNILLKEVDQHVPLTTVLTKKNLKGSAKQL